MKRMFQSAVVILALVFGGGTAFSQDSLSGDDKEFLKNAAELGNTEVEMGKLAQQHGSGAEVKGHGAMMVDAHGKANDELTALAREKGVELKQEPAGSQKQTLDAMAKKSGEEFDKEYIERQTKNHRQAIEMFEDAARVATDPDVRAFAVKQLPHLQHHLAALPGRESARTSETRTEELRIAPSEAERSGTDRKTEGAVEVE